MAKPEIAVNNTESCREMREKIGAVERTLIRLEQCDDVLSEEVYLAAMMGLIKDLRNAVRARRSECWQITGRRCPHGRLIRWNCQDCGRVVR